MRYVSVNYIHWNFLSRIIITTTNEMRKLYNAWKEKKNNDDEEIFGIPTRYNASSYIENSFLA